MPSDSELLSVQAQVKKKEAQGDTVATRGLSRLIFKLDDVLKTGEGKEEEGRRGRGKRGTQSSQVKTLQTSEDKEEEEKKREGAAK